MSRYLGALRHRNFRLLFLGQAASAVGDRVVIVALAAAIFAGGASVTELVVAEALFGTARAFFQPAFTGAMVCGHTTWYALAPVIGRDLHGGAGIFGVLEAVSGAGSVVGALIGIRWRPRRHCAPAWR